MMKLRVLSDSLALVCFATLFIGGGVWAMDEAILTPTNDNIVPAEEQEFGRAMSIWYYY